MVSENVCSANRSFILAHEFVLLSIPSILWNSCMYFWSPSLIFSPPLLQTACTPSVPPTRQNKRYIHLFHLALAESLRRISRALFFSCTAAAAAAAAEHNAIHAAGRKQTQRLLRQPNNVENGRYFLHLESIALDWRLCAVSAEVVHVYFHRVPLIFPRPFYAPEVLVFDGVAAPTVARKFSCLLSGHVALKGLGVKSSAVGCVSFDH